MPRHIKTGALAGQQEEADAKVRSTVETIIADVAKRGDAAVRELSERFDKWSPPSFRLSEDEIAALVAKGAMNGVHFHTDDLQATFEKVRASGAEIVQEPTEQPWGTRDCAVRDPSGNLVRIDQPPAAWS